MRDRLDRISRLNPALNAFITVAADRALERAAAINRRRGRFGALPRSLGVPVAVKDNICTRGCGPPPRSRILDGFVPPYDATVVARLEAAGAVIIGKTNCDEFAMGSSTENSGVRPDAQPVGARPHARADRAAARPRPSPPAWRRSRSAPTPAARSASRPRFCGVVGLKPTYGRVSRYGLIAFASSLDQIGPFARNRRRRGAVLLRRHRRARPARRHLLAASRSPTSRGALTGDIRGLRIGVPRAILDEGVDAEVRARAFDAALDALARARRDARRCRSAARRVRRSRSTT